MSHTKLPWKVYEDGFGFSNGIEAKDSSIVRFGECVPTKEDAAFIVKACNSHYQLLLELTKLTGFINKQQFLGYLNHPEWITRVEKAQEAIKQVGVE